MEAVFSEGAQGLPPCLPATPVLRRAIVGGRQALRRGPTPERPNSDRLAPAVTEEAKQRWLVCQEQSLALSGVTHRSLEKTSYVAKVLAKPGAVETDEANEASV